MKKCADNKERMFRTQSNRRFPVGYCVNKCPPMKARNPTTKRCRKQTKTPQKKNKTIKRKARKTKKAKENSTIPDAIFLHSANDGVMQNEDPALDAFFNTPPKNDVSDMFYSANADPAQNEDPALDEFFKEDDQIAKQNMKKICHEKGMQYDAKLNDCIEPRRSTRKRRIHPQSPYSIYK